ncbi:MAG: S8 family serine peptidase, partial [Candidatus Paceibacterota bacterium]
MKKILVSILVSGFLLNPFLVLGQNNIVSDQKQKIGSLQKNIIFDPQKTKIDYSIKNQKGNLSEPKKKLGSNLLKLIDNSFLFPTQNRAQIVTEMKGLKQFIGKMESVKTIDKGITNKTHGDLVYVYINLESNVQTRLIDSIAWKVINRDENNHLVVAFVEVEKLEAIAALKGVKSITSVLPPVVNSGSVVSEGDMIHQTDDVRSAYSQGGAGIRIGVISDGVDNIATAKSTGDLPAEVVVLSNSVGGDEGTAMLEIIHDMTPAASLYFHDCGSNIVAFSAAIDDLVAAGANVIVDDIGWISQPFFEDGAIASHVASVLASNNIVYVSSAGNDAKSHYQGDYYNDNFDFHDFSRGSQPVNKYIYVEIPSNGKVTSILQWNDNFGFSGNDYDLILLNTNGYSVLASSINPQTGSSDPIESFSYTNTTGSSITAEIDIENYNGSAAMRTLELFIYTSNGASLYANNINPVDSIYGHSAVPGVIAVGAINANDSGADTIETYSSQGPVTIIGQEQRAKPDISGIDCVSVTGAGGFHSPFCGTSAVAPAIAAIVAQLWGQYPTATGNQIKNRILNTAVDLGVAGTETVFGYGRADSLLAFQAGPAISSFNFASLIPAVTGVINNVDRTIALTVPFGTNITALVPTIGINGAAVNPTSGLALDFTNPVTYVVTAADGLTQTYIVTVTTATLSSIAITTPATKLSYTVGDPLDITGLVVTGTYSDASTK